MTPGTQDSSNIKSQIIGGRYLLQPYFQYLFNTGFSLFCFGTESAWSHSYPNKMGHAPETLHHAIYISTLRFTYCTRQLTHTTFGNTHGKGVPCALTPIAASLLLLPSLKFYFVPLNPTRPPHRDSGSGKNLPIMLRQKNILTVIRTGSSPVTLRFRPQASEPPTMLKQKSCG